MSHIASVIYGVEDIRLEPRKTPALAANEAQVEVRATGICGSDLHYHAHYRNGAFAVREPMVLGHEASGEVVAVGSAVTGLRPGDRVAIEGQKPCRMCELCKSGRYNLCADMQFCGSAKLFPHTDGTLQQKLNHAADFLHKIPDSMSFGEAALIEPLSVAMHGVNRSGLRAGQTVTIIGAGAIGLLCGALAKASGASQINIIDISEYRLKFAETYCANRSLKIPMRGRDGEAPVDFAKRLAAEILADPANGFEPADVVYECTGVPTSTVLSISLTAPGGKTTLLGMGHAVQNVNIGDAALREVDIVGVFRYANTYPTAIRLVANGQVDLKSLITHDYALDAVNDAFKFVRRGEDGLIKCIITSGPTAVAASL
ncbi:chaperonin 10-like protein [Dipodascopsis tothii]|uniref:chaperonin 10-like protein n=1 Tax=Dipodascopsis tothii TaxID=44089 RepID=UPI0034D012D6